MSIVPETARSLVGSTNLPRQLNVAGAGPLSNAAHATLTYMVDAHHRSGYSGRDPLIGLYVEARAQVAALMGTLPSLLSFQPSVSAVVTMLSRSVPLGPGDQVLTWDVEYPSNLHAWHVRAQESGAELVRVQPSFTSPWETALLLEQINERTKVVTVSSIQSFDGSATDLYALRQACDEVGAFLFVDLSQHLGVGDVTQAVALADAAYSATHKWLLGPVGLAVASFTPDLLSTLVPSAYGASSVEIVAASEAAVWFDPSRPVRRDISMLEAGTPPLLAAVTAGASAQALASVGVDAVQRGALTARQAIVTAFGLHDMHPIPTVTEAVSPIVAFRPGPEHLAKVVAGLRAERFNFVVRGDILRLSPWALDSDEITVLGNGLERALT